MVKIKCVTLLCFLIASSALFAGGTAAGEMADGVLLCEVQPYKGYEGISVFNYGSDSVNLKGWSVSDGEGTISFETNIQITPGARLTLVKEIFTGDWSSIDQWFAARDNVICFEKDPRIKKTGSFAIADSGDDIYLYRNGVLVDAVCYGNKTASNGWSGDPVKIPSGKYVLRIGTEDTDTSSDWMSNKPGIVYNQFDPGLFFDALVTPFSFPESNGAPIFKEIELAEREVLISIYMITSTELVALLCDILSRGVEVRILLEGAVLGGAGSSQLPLMRSLADAGGEVYFINDAIAGNYERYSYLHNKYAVIDERKVILTSENWTSGNLGPNGNRGWGVVVESAGYAEYVKNVFLNDISREWEDVRSLEEYAPKAAPYAGTLTYSGVPISYETTTYSARVMPSFSPDNSHSALRYFIENAQRRVYSQQMDVGSSYRNMTDPSPLQWMSDAADRGADVKFILDATADKDLADSIVSMLNNTTDVEAIAMDGKKGVFSLIHNKGVVIDDLVWVSSVNWTENSFMNNREASVIIDSPDVAEFFAGLFLEDWGFDLQSDLEITSGALEGGSIHTFTASGPEYSKYIWNLPWEDVPRTSDINRIICGDIPEGTYTITVTLEKTGKTASLEYTAEAAAEDPKPSGGDLPAVPVAAAGAVILAMIGGIITFLRRNINVPRDTSISDADKKDGHTRR
jgi:phosphatidylserine/phosphatidylglycerophosphate/cardiolipin synthase-like enzyme